MKRFLAACAGVLVSVALLAVPAGADSSQDNQNSEGNQNSQGGPAAHGNSWDWTIQGR